MTSRDADLRPNSICVINGTEIPAFSARNCCVHPNSFLNLRIFPPKTKRISVIISIILLSATLDNYLIAIYNVAYGNKWVGCPHVLLCDPRWGYGQKLARGRNHNLRTDGLAVYAVVAVSLERICLRVYLLYVAFYGMYQI